MESSLLPAALPNAFTRTLPAFAPSTLALLRPFPSPGDTARKMLEENVEIVRRVYKLAEARGVEGLLELATDDIVWISDSRFPGGGTYVGKENVRRWLNKIWIYAEVSVDVEEIIDLDDRALGITRFHGVYSDAPPVDWPWCHLFWFRDGLISQAQSFFDRAEALEAAGLSG
jgi:ketosteroid isomerase-like protein